MLKLRGKPEVVSRDPERRLAWKVATFIGRFKPIDVVARQRLADAQCRQLPHGHSLPGGYGVWVSYVVSEDEGYVCVQHVDVCFGPQVSGRWSCFYDGATGRSGTIERAGGNFRFYFLSKYEVCPFESHLSRYEEAQAVARLAKLGPDAFESTEEAPMPIAAPERGVEQEVDDEEDEIPFPDQE